MSTAICTQPDADACVRQPVTISDFEVLAARLRCRLINYLRRRFGDRLDPEECAHLALIRAWRSLDSYDPLRSCFATWLYRIAVNLCRTRLHRRMGRAEVSLDEPGFRAEPLATSFPDPARKHARLTVRQAVRAAIASLPRDERDVVILVELHGLTQAEAALRLNCSEDRVFYHLHKARHCSAASSTAAAVSTGEDRLKILHGFSAPAEYIRMGSGSKLRPHSP